MPFEPNVTYNTARIEFDAPLDTSITPTFDSFTAKRNFNPYTTVNITFPNNTTLELYMLFTQGSGSGGENYLDYDGEGGLVGANGLSVPGFTIDLSPDAQ